MDDDFNTREAIAIMYELARHINTLSDNHRDAAVILVAELKALGGILKILDCNPDEFMQGSIIDNDPQSLHNSEIEVMISKRSAAKNNNNFIEADEIRAQLLANGIVLEDTRNGTTWRKE